MKKKPPRKGRRFDGMNARELAEATVLYDQEMVIDGFGSPNAAARRRWERAQRKPGRPPRGKGAKVISVSVEKGLLSRSDSLARNLGVSRARLIERGLKAVLEEERKHG